MFLPPNPLKESDPNKANESTKGIGSFTRKEVTQLTYASMLGSGVFVFLDSRISTVNALIFGFITSIGFYLLIIKAKQLTKK